MAKKKRPSLKDFLSTGEVVVEEEKEQTTQIEEVPAVLPADERLAPKKSLATARKPRSSAVKRKKTAPDESMESLAGKNPALPPATDAPEPATLDAVVDLMLPPAASAEESASEQSADAAAGTSLEEAAPAEEAASADAKIAPQPEWNEELRSFVDMLCDEDRKTWGNFAVAGTEFLPLDLVERREDFRMMDRSRFTLFRLEEAGGVLFHVRTSVQIREPLIALLKWDETGKIFIYKP